MTGQRAEILLVEDNPNDIKLALHAFKQSKLDHTVHVVRDGVEALEYLFGNDASGLEDIHELPRLILLDLKLPRLDGREVLRRIKADPRTSAIPVVIMTSSKEQADLTENYRNGVNSYIIKPLDFLLFIDAVRDIGNYWLVINHPAPLPA